MQKNQKTIITLALLVGLSIMITVIFQTRRHLADRQRIDEINRQLAQCRKSQPMPHPLSGTLKTRPIYPAAKKNTVKASLTQAVLEPLRASFKVADLRKDQGELPKEKTILLSSRIIEVPDERSFPASLSHLQISTQRDTIPYIVHFGKPITAEMRRNLEKNGAVLRGYLPNYAFLTELTSSSLSRIANNSDIQFVSEFLPEDKIQPFLNSLTVDKAGNETVQLSIQTLDPQDTDAVASLIDSLGGSINHINQLPEWGLINATLALNDIPALSQRGDVQWIEEFVPAQMLNNFAAQPSHLNAVTVQNEWYLTGKGQIVGHADTGLDTGDESTVLADFKGQVAAYFDWSNGGADAADYDGHGTHTAGSICGNGASSGGLYRGIAYEAQLVTQCVVDKDSGSFTGIYDLYALYTQSYLSGATIHSDSWGSSVYGAYDSFSRTTDMFAWNYRAFLPVFAAGNSGRDLNNDGIIDLDSITSPATAKNVLTVGATEGDRSFAMEGFRASRYYNKWPGSFKTNPIKDDFISWSATNSPYLQGMAAFSSRGPTDDNRLKPELSAPGTDIISTRSTMPGSGWLWGILPSNNLYCYSGGTSMATPLTAGSAALIRQYMMEQAGMADPSAALIKATMIGGSHTLAPGQYGTGATQEIPLTSPNNVEGWGQPEIVQMLYPEGLMIKLIDDIAPDTGKTNTYQITVEEAGRPLDIIMCWLDYPGTAGAAVSLINDLNLNVITPADNPLFPNNGSVDDDRNTVESIQMTSAASGIYTINIIGKNVPVSEGSVALYVRGAINETPIIVHKSTPYYDALQAPYAIDFKVQSLNILTNNELCVYYNTGTSNTVTGEWNIVSAGWTSNANYRALIPQLPKNTSLHYYIQLSNDLFTVDLPVNAMSTSQFFTMHLGTPTQLIIDGTPSQSGIVSPEYGTNTLLSGQIFTASAYPEAISATEQLACSGWVGLGDIPLNGSSNIITTSIDQASTLTWNWDTQYTLLRNLYFADVNTSIADGSFWYWKDQPVPDQSTYDLLTLTMGDDYMELYAFMGWSLDGIRWPDATSPSINPLNGLVMESPFTLTANYMLFSIDADSDGLYDWWEQLYFGGTNLTNAAEDDLDGDLWSALAESMDNTNPFDAASYPKPPTIAVNGLNPFQTARPPWTVTARIEDNFILIDAFLEWREKGETLWQRTPMSYLGDGLFSAELNPASHGGRRVDYRVYASDLIGYYSPEFAAISPVYSVIGDFDEPWMQVAPASLGLEEISNQPTNYTVTIENLAGPDLIWTGILVSAAQSFDTAHPGWHHSGINDSWTSSTNRSWNGEAVWYCGDDTNHLYPNSCYASLDTPSFAVGDHDVLIFRHWTKFEADTETDYYWDGAVIMISTNSGSSFAIIESEPGYNAFIIPNDASPFDADQPCYGGNGEGWKSEIVDLAPYAGTDAVIRFVFGSDEFVVDEGWYVGGVTLLSSEQPVPQWFTKTGDWNGTLADQWKADLSFEINPLLMQPDSEHALCLRVDSNDSEAAPIVDLTIRRGFAVSSSLTGNGSVTINDPVIFRDETLQVDIEADYGSYISNITVNGIQQSGDYGYTDTSRHYTWHPVTNDLHFSVTFDLRSWNLDIMSAWGGSSPAAGNYSFTHGSPITATVTSPRPDSNPMIRYSADAHNLIGATPLTDSQGEISFVLTNDTTLTWLWTTNYQMLATSTGNGVVVPGMQWYAAGSYSCTTGYPTSYYHFANWLGDITDARYSGLNGSIIDLPMNTPRTISGAFEANVTAMHGVPESWLAAYGFTDNFDAAAEGDQDNDRMETWKEWRSDTDPTNRLSLLQISSLQITPSLVDATWISGIHRTQLLQRASQPSGPWIDIYTNHPPTGITNSFQMPLSNSNQFFRVVVP